MIVRCKKPLEPPRYGYETGLFKAVGRRRGEADAALGAMLPPLFESEKGK